MRNTGIICAFVALFVMAWTVNVMAAGTRLTAAQSPYLRLHADDAIEWREWTEDALAEARRLDRPILVSVGYLACHWCHVMRRESFADPEIGRLANENFVPILVDREGRPDLDAVFQRAALVMDRPTGWPLTIFLKPDGKPFWSGTYFPRHSVDGMLGFDQVLQRITEFHRSRGVELRENASLITQALSDMVKPKPGDISPALFKAAADSIGFEIDWQRGGFGTAPKFPNFAALEMLWRLHLRTGDEEAGEAVRLSLSQMIAGGLHDHVGGGFFRYTVDAEWRVPHFEKMLDVNAAAIRLITEVWRETGDPELERAVRAAVGFMLRELRLADGGFATSLDADSLDDKGEELEGAFYRWHKAEIVSALGQAAASELLGIYGLADETEATPFPETEKSNLGGVLYRLVPGEATILGVLPGTVVGSIERLLSTRADRSRPRRDEKVVAEWNAMAIEALSEAGIAFGEAKWLEAARLAFDFVEAKMISKDRRFARYRFARYWFDGAAAGVATISDVSRFASAAMSLHKATGRDSYLALATDLAEMATAQYLDVETGAYFGTAGKEAANLMRIHPVLDDPNPSGNAVMADTMARLFYLTGDNRWWSASRNALRAFGGMASMPDVTLAGYYNAVDTLHATLQVVIVGARGEPQTRAMLTKISSHSLMSLVLKVISPDSQLPTDHPAAGKGQIDGLVTVYVCHAQICSLPVTDPSELSEVLQEMRRSQI